jgi:ABC-type lipoprotein export system ATPase subunit
MNKLEIKNIYKYFILHAQKTIIIDDFSYIFESGKLYFIKGFSGSGKTTLLNIIAQQDSIYDGNIYLNNIDIKEIGSDLYFKKISYMRQFNELLDNVLLYDQLKLKAYFQDVDLEFFLNKYLPILEVDYLFKKKINEMSGGEIRKAYLLYSLCTKASVFIFDEPTVHMGKDFNVIFKKIIDLLFQNKEIIVLFSTHEFFEEEQRGEKITKNNLSIIKVDYLLK